MYMYQFEGKTTHESDPHIAHIRMYLSCGSGCDAAHNGVGGDEGVGAGGAKSESSDGRLHGVVSFVD